MLAGPAEAMPTASVNFLALGHTNTPTVVTGTPPHTTGAVGLNDYVEAVNGGIEVFSKTGAVLQAAKALNTLWTGYTGTNAGNGCASHNDGDPVVRYDRAADRWIIAQFSLPNTNTDTGPSYECVAVSKTGDPLGAYNLYDFKYPYAVNDSPSIGVWPDAYYATFGMFGTSAYKGVDVCAWNRARMLAGQSVTPQCFFMSAPSNPACPAAQSFTPYGVIPASDDGSLPPPTGTPEFLMQFDYSQCGPTYNKLDLWTLHIDWNTPANSALSGPTPITVSNFTPACYVAPPASVVPDCIPQPGSSVKLDALDDRLMDRLTYRNFGTYESLLLDHTVQAGAGAGIRWYEIRSPSTTPTVYQQGTYAPPDANWRWLGSMAQDQAGDIAMGFSASAASGGVAHPAIGWTGRLGIDTTLGTMTQGEAIIDVGGANESDAYSGQNRGRWGETSSMTVDPSDDCTFWYANELYPTAGVSTWDTYIASFKFPRCGANDFSIAPPAGVAALQGRGGNTTVSTTRIKGSAENVSFSAWDLPPGASASFAPASVAAGGSSTLTLTAGLATPPGTYTVQLGGTAPSAVHGTAVTFTVNSASILSVTKSGAGSGTVTSSPAGIDCGSVCGAGFAPGSTVTLSAAPDPGSVFLGWSGPGCGSTCVLTMDSNKAVIANFGTVGSPGSGGSPGVLGGPSGGSGGTLSPTQPPFTGGSARGPGPAVACEGLKGKKLTRCRALRRRNAALRACARLGNKQKRTACVKSAQRTYRKALGGAKSRDVASVALL